MRAPCTALLSSLCLLHLSPLFARSVGGGSRQMCQQLELLRDTFIAIRENLTDEDSISFINLTTNDVLKMSSDERCALSKMILTFYLNVAFKHKEAKRLVTPTQRSLIGNYMLPAKQRLTCARVFKKKQFSQKSKEILNNMRHAKKVICPREETRLKFIDGLAPRVSQEPEVLLRRAFRDMELIEMLCVDGGD